MVREEFKFVQRPASHLRAINLIHCELYQMPAFEYGVRGFITKSQLPAFKPTRVPATSGAGRWTAQSERRRAPPRRAWPGCSAPRRGAFLLAPRRGAPRVARAARGHSAPSTGAFGPITSLSHKFQHLFPCALYFPRRAVDVQDPVHKSLVVTQHVTGSMHHVIRDELLTIHTGPSTHEINASVHV